MRTPFLIIILLGFISFQSCTMGELDPYKRKVEAQRFTKDSFFKLAEESPIPFEDKIKFLELDYYKPSKEYKLNAPITLLTKIDTIELPGPRGDITKYLKFAKVNFKLNGKENQLLLLKPIQSKETKDGVVDVFIPFTDLTTDKTTYGAGRYIETQINIHKSTMELDFNTAFNPFCAYNENYTCPVPPEENKLTIPIEAGEKKYAPYFSTAPKL